MIQLKHLIVDRDTRDSRAIMDFDLQGAFDHVNHSAILGQVSKLNIGKRTYAYIRSFLTGQTAEIATKAVEVGSRGTRQRSVISRLLFNLVMIELANRLAEVENVGHTIYVDDITLCVESGSNAHVEKALQ